MSKNNSIEHKHQTRFTGAVLFFTLISLVALFIGFSYPSGPYGMFAILSVFALYCLYVFYPRKNGLINNTRRACFAAGVIFLLCAIRWVIVIALDRNSQGSGNAYIALFGPPSAVICFVPSLILVIAAKLKPSEIFK